MKPSMSSEIDFSTNPWKGEDDRRPVSHVEPAEEYRLKLKDYYEDLMQFPELYEEELLDAELLVERLRFMYAND